jgi:hypothetical protein
VTALLNPTTYTVDPWDPGYGVADELDARESTARVELDFELPADRWRPLRADPNLPLPRTMLFLDGVRRIDARVWVHNGQPQPVPGVVASLAAGLVRCDGAARIIDVQVDRGLYTAARDATDLRTRHAKYIYRHAPGGLDKLTLAVQRRLTELEVELAASWRATSTEDDDLLIVDGPLLGRTHLARTVGYIKTHNKSYLPPEQTEVVAALAPAERTPVFTMGTSWDRHSWYLRLPGTANTHWSALVRLECPANLPREEAVRLADITTLALPTLASTPHKDPRAPQNLVPIGGLERQLRHRLGDQALLYRSLRTALR